MDDSLIVDLFLKRDESALKETQSKYGSRLLRISENILKNPSEAEECENDTYLAAWKSIPPNSPRDYLFAYLAKIIRNFSFNIYKKKQRQKSSAMIVELSSEMEECIPAPDNFDCRLKKNEFTAMMNLFLHRLKENHCRVFLLRYWYCEPISAIAEEMSISEGTIKSILSRTRKKLKGFIESEGYVL